uniref:Uncharacterized protein n=1 Tax=viral metagenome TaxID=1070528 RepID=A0A6M3KVD2_9ZZZZ
MGKSIICNYVVQVYNPITQNLHLIGAMSFKEAQNILFDEARRLDSDRGYIWPQTKIAERKINNISWVTNRFGIDYLKITIDVNTPERKKYTMSGQSCQEENLMV